MAAAAGEREDTGAGRREEELPPHGAECASGARRRRNASILDGVSIVAIVLLVAAAVLLVAAEWPRLARGRRLPTVPGPRGRRPRKPALKVVRSESDDFARSVERDLASLPTIDERDAKKR